MSKPCELSHTSLLWPKLPSKWNNQKKTKIESLLRINKNRIQAIYTSFDEFSYYLPQGTVETLLFIYAYFKHFLQRIALIDLLAFPWLYNDKSKKNIVL